jgi:hypothetical protein
MHTDGKPRVVMMCDVGVSKGGGVCGVFVRRGGEVYSFPPPYYYLLSSPFLVSTLFLVTHRDQRAEIQRDNPG